jgi:putative membrane protein
VDPDRLDVDARFLLANERTLLAWVRTALTLLAAGFAVQELADDSRGRTPLALVLLLAGAATVLAGGARYRAADRAIRAGRLPSQNRSPYVLVAGVALLALAAGVLVLFRG